MTRATWRPEEQAWLDANPHGLPPESPYGRTGPGVFGQPYGHGPGMTRSATAISAPQKLLSEREIAEWRPAHPEATCSDKTARCLAWLEGEFGR